jgi:hypothetical protein
MGFQYDGIDGYGIAQWKVSLTFRLAELPVPNRRECLEWDES